MNLLKNALKVSALSVSLFMSHAVLADEAKGLEIAQERNARDEGWGDSVATMKMILRNAQGESSTRLMRLQSLEVEDDGDKGLTIFDEPRDVKGTAFLNHSHTVGADDQWLYLPALKRVKRISSRNKSGPFMGSEFAYEDLSSFEIEKYRFNYLKDDTINGQDVFVIEQIPTDKSSGYTKQTVWLDKAHYRPLKVEFYDRKGSLLKTLSFSDYKQYLNQYWRAHTMAMTNHQTGKSTELTTSEMRFNTGLEDNDFHKNVLKRVR
ncbi:outer membrane lipoprotein-sorting protein [Vibrio sp. RM-44-3]|uniref:outer membrane lipoprotein-sorting protein n=1 Tax=unclassified Vibrio TaxID=2614977 RepID=UPI00215B8268|nr:MULTISPECIES: outer membrane lipoprotein-sorting protein [unclassified Vibrio]MCR9551772.1 outer membrane lipoprotein-sorting protein [Vibrio sp. RM-41-2A]MCR9558428.1 outer membrane lipoprotein-sorting protein [Vibrio sp. RM-41-2B]MCR9624692.1 outer membrane lipoprotein-sorting protein [Vibrio sp. RM-44-3]